MRRNGRIGLGVLLVGAVGLASIGIARSADKAKPCCFTNEGYTGVCRVVPTQDESCAGILAYLNDPNSSGKDYCGTTGNRGGWQQASCGDERSGPAGSASSPNSVSAWRDKGIGAVLAKDAETYTSPTQGTVQYHLKAGTIFGFFTPTGGWGKGNGKNGLFGVAFIADNNEGEKKATWVKEEDLGLSSWECAPRTTAGELASKRACIPADGTTRKWRLSFRTAAGEKCKELGIGAFRGSVFVESAAPAPVEPPTVPTTPVGPSAMPTTPVEPPTVPTTPLGPSAMPATPTGPSAMPTTPVGPSAMPTTPEGPPPTTTAPVRRTSPGPLPKTSPPLGVEMSWVFS